MLVGKLLRQHPMQQPQGNRHDFYRRPTSSDTMDSSRQTGVITPKIKSPHVSAAWPTSGNQTES